MIEENRRILFVNDDIKYCRLISEYLSRHGFDAEITNNGTQAIELAGTGDFHMIVLDAVLHATDGYEVLKGIRQSSIIPVIMLTELGVDEDHRITGLELGADDYLPKSFSAREVLARLRAVLRRTLRVNASASQFTASVLTINSGNRTATLKGKYVNLTPIEFDLLFFLAQDKGILKSREQILKALGEKKYDASFRSIDVHISAIRKKLNDSPKNPRLIRTVRAAGYVLSDLKVVDVFMGRA